jgi:hypothetical protein
MYPPCNKVPFPVIIEKKKRNKFSFHCDGIAWIRPVSGSALCKLSDPAPHEEYSGFLYLLVTWGVVSSPPCRRVADTSRWGSGPPLSLVRLSSESIPAFHTDQV